MSWIGQKPFISHFFRLGEFLEIIAWLWSQHPQRALCGLHPLYPQSSSLETPWYRLISQLPEKQQKTDDIYIVCTSELTTKDIRRRRNRIHGNRKKCRNILILVKLFYSSCHEETLSIAPNGTLITGHWLNSNLLKNLGHQLVVGSLFGVGGGWGGGGHTLLRERGWGVPVRTRGELLWYPCTKPMKIQPLVTCGKLSRDTILLEKQMWQRDQS